ncbi:basic amino acid ABC transporter substrate-binding protein [Jeongeupia chitinilytica]|uniref:Basic amino acid ABC transporter substrate-binding protein n=1 Tax=Jeongeupia chitinilytica TaxID=1041641 RepID=A0ABQ3GY78_9NEIS|nr:basic amino acid ABC transporter substrate-binding protein [Jeongeupia chitinilytica]GHD59413.1 basic amino acid ABC transporter substrate-binding protein [Jeongeupia chitinilytica]
MKSARSLLASLIACACVIAPATASARTYTAGAEATFAPFESLNQKREVVGFDADIIAAIGKKAGLDVKMVNTPWEGLFMSLNNGDIDIAASAITITPERQKTMDFSQPYFEAQQLIVVPEGSKIASMADLKGKKVGVQTGTTGDIVSQDAFGKTTPNIRRYESITLAIQELRDGGLQAVVGDNAVVKNYLKNNPGAKFKLVDDKSFKKEYYGIAVRKGNKQLLDQINKGLGAIKADGTYQTIYNKYFGK